MGLFKYFQQYPLLGFLFCAGILLFANTPQKVLEGAKIEGFMKSPKVIQGIAMEKFTRPGRKGSLACMVRADVAGSLQDMRLDCGEWNMLQPNGLFGVVLTSRGPASLSIMKGQFYIDFLLLALEITGIFYFLSMVFDKMLADPPAPSPSTTQRKVAFQQTDAA